MGKLVGTWAGCMLDKLEVWEPPGQPRGNHGGTGICSATQLDCERACMVHVRVPYSSMTRPPKRCVSLLLPFYMCRAFGQFIRAWHLSCNHLPAFSKPGCSLKMHLAHDRPASDQNFPRCSHVFNNTSARDVSFRCIRLAINEHNSQDHSTSHRRSQFATPLAPLCRFQLGLWSPPSSLYNVGMSSI